VRPTYPIPGMAAPGAPIDTRVTVPPLSPVQQQPGITIQPR